MSLKSVNRETQNLAELEILIEKSVFDAEVDKVFKKNAEKITVPGFRKGKAPRKIIEKMYGTAYFFEEAIDNLLPDEYAAAVAEAGIDPVSRPEIDVKSMDDNGVLLTAKVYTKPEAVVADYKGIEVKKDKVRVTKDEIAAEIDKIRERNARILTLTDVAAENGDEVVIDFEGFVDGVAFEGGKAEKYSLKLGSHSFIEGFEEQLIGKVPSEELFDINVNFPADYGAENLAGKPAVFKIKLHEVKRTDLPVLDEEFVKDVSEFDTVAEYEADIKAKIKERKTADSDRKLEEDLINAIVEKTTVEIPDCMIETEIDGYVRDYDYRLQMQGGSLDLYYKYTGQTEEQLRESFKSGAEKQVKTRLALEFISKTENITATEEEIEAEYAKIAAGYAVEIEKVKSSIPVSGITEDVVLRKAVDFVKENAVIK
ncbi:MAG: trigger factor [Clostridia bacterium]|nr:trigger factor [Clostridia bacterium]MBO7246587.1 trigger factor [Clostridia bacterium]MBQ5841979.1 trigger factor [Clostridia bacterium]